MGFRTPTRIADGGTAYRSGNSQMQDRVAVAEFGELGKLAQEPHEIVGGRELKERVEEAQAQDLGLDRNLDEDWEMERRRRGADGGQISSGNNIRETDLGRTDFHSANSRSSPISQALTPKELAVARELRVGQGPVCGPARVKPEVLERIRLREAARAGSRSP